MGRTKTMLQQAVAAAIAGNTVLVIARNPAQAKDMFHMLNAHKLLPSHASGNLTNLEMSLWPQGQIRFKSAEDPDWDKNTRSVKGYPHGQPTFIDHNVDEKDDSKHA